ncbi:MAG: hypothetical protein JRJ79_17575 [Deltaproteobacteria bacterium]|nr:hypothetical protein [Deltaproteobacteria bacterium]
MEVKLVKNSKAIGQVTPKWAVLQDGKYVCGGNTQKEALDKWVASDTLGSIQNLVRLGQYRRAAKRLR